MQASPTVLMLYDTLDSLIALKLDLELCERRGTGWAPEGHRRMSSDIDHSIANLRAVLAGLEPVIVQPSSAPAAD